MKAVVFERQQGQIEVALSILEEALKKYPKFAKLYMIQGQIHQAKGNTPSARAAFAAGLKNCPKDPNLWILASRLEEADGIEQLDRRVCLLTMDDNLILM